MLVWYFIENLLHFSFIKRGKISLFIITIDQNNLFITPFTTKNFESINNQIETALRLNCL